MIEKAPAVADRKFINGRGKHAVTVNGRDIATIADEVEAIRHRGPIDYFRRKCRRSVTPTFPRLLAHT
jgi:hypothetical protein